MDGADNVVKSARIKKISPVIAPEGFGHVAVIEPHGNGVDRTLWKLLLGIQRQFHLTLDIAAFGH